MSFEAYLRELADAARPLAVSRLTSVSSMASEETALFAKVWPEMEVQRRLRVIQELVELVEDNVELNFEAVFMIALADRDAAVRREAIKGLWEYEGLDLLDALVRLLESAADAGVRAEAALALGRFVLQAEFGALRSSDAERVEQALQRTITDASEVAEVRGRALESIGARGEPWVRDLIQEAFESADRRLRLSAVHAMGRSCDVVWLPDLFPELESDDAEMRFEAAVACGSIADEAATPYLIRLLDDEDHEVQEATIAALGEVGGVHAKGALEELLATGDESLREAVLSAQAEVEFVEDPLAFNAPSEEVTTER